MMTKGEHTDERTYGTDPISPPQVCCERIIRTISVRSGKLITRVVTNEKERKTELTNN